MLYSDLPGVYIMGYIPYVGFATHRRATVKIRLYFKRLTHMQMFCITKKKKKKRGRHIFCRHPFHKSVPSSPLPSISSLINMIFSLFNHFNNCSFLDISVGVFCSRVRM
jgi:hypothetical protein